VTNADLTFSFDVYVLGDLTQSRGKVFNLQLIIFGVYFSTYYSREIIKED
jgi:hypothetical protein